MRNEYDQRTTISSLVLLINFSRLQPHGATVMMHNITVASCG